MDCEKVQPLLSLYMMGDLEKEERESVDAHLSECDKCEEEIDALKELMVQLSSDRVVDPGEDFWEEFHVSVMKKVEELDRGKSSSIVESLKKFVFTFPEMRFAGSLAYAVSIVAVAILGTLFTWKAHIKYSRSFEETVSLESSIESTSETGFVYTNYLEDLAGEELNLVSRAVSGWGIEVSPSTHDIVSGMTGESSYEIYSEIEYMDKEELDLLYEAIEDWQRSS